MAKQISAPDPVSAAMSAIESALNLTDDEVLPSSESAPSPLALARSATQTPVLKPPAPAAEAAPLLRPSSGAAASASEADVKPALSSTPPANDDRETVGVILQALNAQPPSRTPFVLAVIGSLAWAGFCALYGYQNLWPVVSSSPLRETLLRPETPLLALATLAPIFCIFAFAALTRRLGELRQSARAISQVAVRLAEPETMAGEHVATLSQAIRRELTSMGDGVERALTRAAELETRVRSEVSTLARTYSDNERKIQSLIAEMADQREAILASGSRVEEAITTAQARIAHDLDSAGTTLSERLTQTGQRLAASFGASSDEIVSAMDRSGAATLERLAAEGAQIAVSIAGVGESLAARLGETSQRTAGDMVDRIGDVDGRIKAAGEALGASMDARSDELIARLNSSQSSIVDAIGLYGDQVAARVTEVGDSAHQAVAGL
ncbi:MAG: hypothetical protein JO288_23280, partial [Hyphomicrobiales bacterium]|nr:hypothetical protein [Hyphomicrobiales bacterium]